MLRAETFHYAFLIALKGKQPSQIADSISNWYNMLNWNDVITVYNYLYCSLITLYVHVCLRWLKTAENTSHGHKYVDIPVHILLLGCFFPFIFGLEALLPTKGNVNVTTYNGILRQP